MEVKRVPFSPDHFAMVYCNKSTSYICKHSPGVILVPPSLYNWTQADEKGKTINRKPTGKVLGHRALKNTVSDDMCPLLKNPMDVFLSLLCNGQEGAFSNILNLCDEKSLKEFLNKSS